MGLLSSIASIPKAGRLDCDCRVMTGTSGAVYIASIWRGGAKPSRPGLGLLFDQVHPESNCVVASASVMLAPWTKIREIHQ